MEKENIQTEVNRLLQRGIVFGIIWIMGIGSIIAVTSGIQALQLMKKSGYKLEGKGKAVRCISIGITGILIVITVIVLVMIYRKK